ncbi:MAG: NAD-dependent aldehyde dehydrogenase [Frankiales bacterium]|nr:NAD-dependent aldehyde dehydrogenase [Frankiales bacterium]
MTTPAWVAGKAVTGGTIREVHHPGDGSLVGTVAVPGAADVERAVAAAAAVAKEFRSTPAHVRAAALDHVSAGIRARAEEIADLIVRENGKPLKWAQSETNRAVSTFRWAAEEARRWSGDLQRLDTDPTADGRLAVTRRVPYGPVLGIAPFNFPLNLVAHKVAPALAVGAPIVLKPAPATPLSSLLLGELLAETDLPEGSWSVLPLDNAATAELVKDERLPVVSFTGSVPVGWGIRDAVPRKQVVLELGGNAAVVVTGDYADLEWAATRVATFGMYQAGQSCVAVQRVFVARSVLDGFRDQLVKAVESLSDVDDVGPLIDERAAARVAQWVQEAVDGGATLLTGGGRDGTTMQPTVLEGAASGAKVLEEEVFGPVLVLEPFDDLDEAFGKVNDSRFGLQAGVFTTDVQVAFRAFSTLEVGGVVIGDVPSYRADQMPYGGVKDSGRGREGLRSAMHDLTEERVMVLTGLTL